MFVIPETFTNLLYILPPRQCVIWWESVDNYKTTFIHDCHYNGLIKAIYHAFKKTFSFQKLKQHSSPAPLRVLRKAKANLFQSQYANMFLIKNKIGIPKFPLSDYLNEQYFLNEPDIDLSRKENIILFNPKKGKKETKRIIKKLNNFVFVPLVNLSNEEMILLMGKAKIYIDFGSHPGKDRLPREAAMMHCCIITNMCGAAAFYDDVPILQKYKFNDYNLNFRSLEKCIENCFNNFSTSDKDFDEYRIRISNEKSKFLNDISCFSSLIS